MWKLLLARFFFAVDEPYVRKNVGAPEEQEMSGNHSTSGSSSDQATIQLMAKMMEGLANLQRQILENKEEEGDAETARGQQELPALPERHLQVHWIYRTGWR